MVRALHRKVKLVTGVVSALLAGGAVFQSCTINVDGGLLQSLGGGFSPGLGGFTPGPWGGDPNLGGDPTLGGDPNMGSDPGFNPSDDPNFNLPN